MHPAGQWFPRPRGDRPRHSRNCGRLHPGSPAHAGTRPAERQQFQYTIDLQRTSKPKPQKTTAEQPAAKQRKPKREPPPVTQEAPVRPKKPVQRRDAYDEAKNKTTERREYKRIRAREERQRAKELGRCRSCPNPAIPDQTRCPTCADKHRQSHRRHSEK